MNPVELDRGRSFKGLAAYLLHDPKLETSERVGWTQSFNLNDADPDRAWRLMASTAQSADALKEAAGIKTTGRKSTKPVYHFTLTWSETDQVSEPLQQKAVHGALKALGLEGHQALAVQHTDGKPHVHVMVNLIDHETGVSAATATMQPNGKKASKLSNSQRKLRTWANQFEQTHGLEITEGSRINAQKRKDGEEVDARRKPRNIYEQEKREGKDRRLAWLRKQETGLAQLLQAENKAMESRFTAEWTSAKETYQAQRAALTAARQADIDATIADIKASYKPKWAQTFKESRQKLEQHDKAEKGAVSKLFNMGRTFMKARQKGASMSDSFVASALSSERRLFVEEENQKREQALGAQLRRDITAAIEQVKRGHNVKLDGLRRNYLEQCGTLKAEQKAARTEQRQKWQTYKQRRKGNFQQITGQEQARGRGMTQTRGYNFDPD
jgi:hypothetical protein